MNKFFSLINKNIFIILNLIFINSIYFIYFIYKTKIVNEKTKSNKINYENTKNNALIDELKRDYPQLNTKVI